MPIHIDSYSTEHRGAVKDFNARLDAGGVAAGFRFPADPTPAWLPPQNGRRIFQQMFVARDETGAVRGGYILKRQDFMAGGSVRSIGYYHLPLSEGLINRSFIAVGARLLRDALVREPMLYCLGMGGLDQPLPRMLTAMGWTLELVPFYFYVAAAGRFLRELPALGASGMKRVLSRAASVTGTGALAIRVSQRARTHTTSRGLLVEMVPEFGDWVNAIWSSASASSSGFRAVRNLDALHALYNRQDYPFLRLKFSRGNAVVGWAVLLDTQMSNSQHFGNLRVGSIADCEADPEEAAPVARVARDFLVERGADLVITNQSHACWQAAFRAAGFWTGPSNFIFARSKALAPLTMPLEACHITRGDGDGPIHL